MKESDPRRADSYDQISYVTVTAVKYRVGITGGVLVTVVDN